MNREFQNRKHFSYNDAAMFKDHVVRTWKPVTDVWALKYGDIFLGSIGALGSIFVTFTFRKELKIAPFARLTCYLPVAGMSAVMCHISQSFIISSDILRSNACPLCISTKASIMQILLGVAYPILSAPTVCFYIADKLLTYPVPPLARAPREVFQLFQKIVMKNPRQYAVISALNMIAASVITFQKSQNFQKVELKVTKS